MRHARPNYIWRKSATRAWLSANEVQLTENTGGGYAVIERPLRQRLIVEAFCGNAQSARRLQKAFGGATVELPADWEAGAFAATKVKPLNIGNRLTVTSDAADVPNTPDAQTLVIPAGAAFGTGGHATTAMSLRILERVTRRLASGWRMFDAGTGSGILALAGRRFGAGEVVALENDPLALATAKRNAGSNAVRGVQFRLADATRQQQGTFDVITANLYSELLISALPQWRDNVRNDSHIIISGVMRTQEPAILRALAQNGYAVAETRRRGKWIALLCRLANRKADRQKRS